MQFSFPNLPVVQCAALKVVLSLYSIVSLIPICKGQSIQYSQYYANQLYLNPAFAGTSYCTRLNVSFRDQWPNLHGKYVTYSFFADHYLKATNGGIGFIATHDRINTSGIVSSSVSGIYSQHINLGNEWAGLVALQGTYLNRQLNYSNLTYNDQYSNSSGYMGIPSADYLRTITQNIFDLSSGILLYSPKLWVGLSAHHLTRPKTSVLDVTENLPVQYSLHAGYKLYLNPQKRDLHFTPTFQYKHQLRFDQLDVGSYFTYEPMQIGVWYRGIPFKLYENIPNNESVVFLVGFHKDRLRVAYSYDLVMSSLAAKSGGAHEISLGFVFCHEKKNVGKKRKEFKYKVLPCPTF